MRKTKFRKIVAGFCLAVLCTGSVLTVQAAPSPSNSDLKPEVVSPSQSGSNSQTTNSDSDTNSNTGSSTTVTNTSNITTIDSDTERYENKAVADAVGKTQKKQENVTAAEIVEEVVKANTEVNKDKGTVVDFKAINGDSVNLTMYDMATAFTDLVIKEDDVIRYESGTKVEASVKVEALKNEKAEDLIIMQIDTTTGEVYLIPVESLDPETGELTAEFQTLGAFTVMKKVPVVVTDAAGVEYGDQEINDNVKKLLADEDADKKVTLTEVLKTFKQDTKEVTSDNGKSYDPSKYTAATNLASLAIKKSDDEYLYNMKGKISVDAHVNIESTDWERIVSQAYPDADIDALKKDPSKLADLGEKSLEDGFITITSPETGETAVVDDLTISFVKEDSDDVTGKANTVSDNVLAKVQSLFCKTVYAAEGNKNAYANWDVQDERTFTDNMDLVISTEVESMGAFMLFLPSDDAAATDASSTTSTVANSPVKTIVIVVIALVVVAGVFVGVRSSKKKK